jgi:hypothetical protein
MKFNSNLLKKNYVIMELIRIMLNYINKMFVVVEVSL